MRIVNEKYLSLIWNWDDLEENALVTKYQTNLERLLYAIHDRIEQGQSPPADDLRQLAGELQTTGEKLQESADNCLAAAQTVYAYAGSSEDDRNKRQQFFEQLPSHIGKPVVLKQTSAEELEGKQLTLRQIRGIKAVLEDEGGLWEALIDFLVPVLDLEDDNGQSAGVNGA